jgi:pimeloyl-ACP methyl ester carboxylesterase
VPTVLIHGGHDPAVPVAWAERAQRLILGSQMVVIPESGHITPLERPRAFNEALRRYLGTGG